MDAGRLVGYRIVPYAHGLVTILLHFALRCDSLMSFCVLGHRLSRLLFRARLPDYGIYCFRVTVVFPADGRICGECNTELLTAVRAVRTIDVACYQRLFNSPGDLRDPQVAKSDFDSLCNVIERENCP